MSDISPTHKRRNTLESAKIERPFYFAIIPTKRGNSMTAEYKVHGDVAVITLMNPPVNGLGLSTRVGITDGLEKANNDPAVKAAYLGGGH